MRAAVVTEPGGPEVFKVIERDDPTFGPDEVLVDVKASALNRADLAQRRGNYPAPSGIPQDIPGLEMAGVVAAVGQHVTSLREGDRVFGLIGGGGYATRVATHERMAMPIPEGMTFTEAASIPEVFFTAYDALFTNCNLVMGESALIHAAGSGIGIAGIQLARHAGADHLRDGQLPRQARQGSRARPGRGHQLQRRGLSGGNQGAHQRPRRRRGARRHRRTLLGTKTSTPSRSEGA